MSGFCQDMRAQTLSSFYPVPSPRHADPHQSFNPNHEQMPLRRPTPLTSSAKSSWQSPVPTLETSVTSHSTGSKPAALSQNLVVLPLACYPTVKGSTLLLFDLPLPFYIQFLTISSCFHRINSSWICQRLSSTTLLCFRQETSH